MEFSKQEYWSGLPCPPPGDLPNPGIKPRSPALWAVLYHLSHQGSPVAAAAKSLQSCLTVQPHRWQPTRLPCPWDSPGKNTGVGCHFLLQCIKVKSESEVAQLCLTLSDPMDCSLSGSSVHGIFQARVLLERGAIAFSEGKPYNLLNTKWNKNIKPCVHSHLKIRLIDIILSQEGNENENSSGKSVLLWSRVN